jgi:hypothetical protein
MMTFLVDVMKMMGAIFLNKHKPSNNKSSYAKQDTPFGKASPSQYIST